MFPGDLVISITDMCCLECYIRRTMRCSSSHASIFAVLVTATSCGTGGSNGIEPMIDSMPIGIPPAAPTAVTAEAIAVAATVTLLAGSDTLGGVVDGSGDKARFSSPQDIAVDSAGNVYVAEFSSHIRKIAPTGEVSTFATLPKSAASGIALDPAGNVYVKGFFHIYRIRPTGELVALAGSDAKGAADGQGSEASFNGGGGIDVDPSGDTYVADFQNHRVRRVTPGGLVSTLAGSMVGFADGAVATAQFHYPGDAAVDRSGNVYVADYANQRVRRITGATVSTVAGSGTYASVDGVSSAASFRGPRGIAIDRAGNVYVAEFAAAGRVRRITPGGAVTSLGTSIPYARSVAVDASGNIYVCGGYNLGLFVGAVRKITSVGIGELKVAWQASTSESPISDYVATATADGQEQVTCSSSGETTCILRGLVSGVAYDVTVVATSAGGTSVASTTVRATPN